MRRDSGSVVVALALTTLAASVSGRSVPGTSQAKLGFPHRAALQISDTKQAPRVQAYTSEFKPLRLSEGNFVQLTLPLIE